jgi:hypothetical protein
MHIFSNSDHKKLAEIRKKHLKILNRLYEMPAEPKQAKAAALSAAVKNLKRDLTFLVIDRIAESHQIDMTTTVGGHITKLLLGRSVALTTLIERYGTPGRSAADKSAALDNAKYLESVCDPLKDEFRDFINTEIFEIKEAASITSQSIRAPMPSKHVPPGM